MERGSATVRNSAITAIVIGFIVAAGALLLPSASSSIQVMTLDLGTGKAPPPQVTKCASPLSTGSAYALADAGKDKLDCPATISHRRWTAGVAGVVALTGVVTLFVVLLPRRRRPDEDGEAVQGVGITSAS